VRGNGLSGVRKVNNASHETELRNLFVVVTEEQCGFNAGKKVTRELFFVRVFLSVGVRVISCQFVRAGGVVLARCVCGLRARLTNAGPGQRLDGFRGTSVAAGAD
jgi:hypothetical protein